MYSVIGNDNPKRGLNFILVNFQSASKPVAFSQTVLNSLESTDSPKCKKSNLTPVLRIKDSISNLFSTYKAPEIGLESNTHLVLPYSGNGPGGLA